MEKPLDRRAHERFLARNGTIAAVISDTGLKLGVISDMSKGGLAFRYIEQNPQESLVATDMPCKVDILVNEENFYAEKLPCTVVAENALPPENLYIPLPMKKCRIRFGELTANQMSQIDHFLDNFTLGKKPYLPHPAAK